MPRYPNCWFAIRSDLPFRRAYQHAVVFLTEVLEDYLGYRDYFVKLLPCFRQETQNWNEGCDMQARRNGLQRWDSLDRTHDHQVHLRIYSSALSQVGKEMLRYENEEYFIIPISLHYEVSSENALHPSVDECPFCGLKGEYRFLIESESNDYCVFVHDPLGLECFIDGRIKGSRIAERNHARVRCAADLEHHFGCEILRFGKVHDTCRHLALILLEPSAKE
jgi:hypothetical protein